MADGLSAAAANSYSIRKTTRERARYEFANNSFCRGIARTLSNDLIGTGPRLQMQSGDKDLDRFVEAKIKKWFRAMQLSRKLRTGRIARSVDGEAFFLRVYNPRLPGPIKTSVRLVECDYFDDPVHFDEPNKVGGITFDAIGEPLSYTMLKSHPGDIFAAMTTETETIPGDDLVHWFTSDRPGQVRGVTEMLASLSLYSQLRRWTLAVLQASELAADLAAVLETQSTPLDADGEPEYDEVDPFESVEIDRGMMVAMPKGYKMNQFKPEQPTTNYTEFRNAIINEAGRSEQMPAGKSRGDSSSYNYASGRLDNQDYYEGVEVDRDDTGVAVLDKMVGWWVEEARLVYPEAADLDPDDLPDHEWYWDGHPHADEVKHAAAVSILVDKELVTKDEVLLSEGRDPEKHWEQIRRQRQRDTELDKIGPSPAALATPNPTPDTDDE